MRWIRSTGPDVPVIFLAARDGVPDRVAGFAAGADDYVTKPFSLGEDVHEVTDQRSGHGAQPGCPGQSLGRASRQDTVSVPAVR